MNKKVLIINGANLNLTGSRQKNIYGEKPFEDYLLELKNKYPTIDIEYKQSNIEGQIVDFLQQASEDMIILNAGGYSHTSVVIRDAISAIKIPVVDVHISNIFAREDFRKQDLISPVCQGTIIGFGLYSYELALNYLLIRNN